MFLSRDEVRALDRRAIEEFGVPGIVLMENAGRGAADVLMNRGARGPVVVCCGSGNNGGDGLVIARHLDLHQIPVKVLLFRSPDTLSGDAAVNFRIVERSGLPLAVHLERPLDGTSLPSELASAEWIVDALFGTGLNGPVKAPYDNVIGHINGSKTAVFAVDIPSGLDCDTGEPTGPTIRARVTGTFVARKKGFAAPNAQEWLGEVEVIGIGAPRRLVGRFKP